MSTKRSDGNKALFTPGPLNCTLSVKKAMLRDLGSRDLEFIQTVKEIRLELLRVAGVGCDEFTALLLQGSGTYAVEAVLHTVLPRSGGKILILVNGAYGRRMQSMCSYVPSIEVVVLEFGEDEAVCEAQVENLLRESKIEFSAVCVVHCETSSGVINPIESIGRAVKRQRPECVFVVDAMSSFGAVELDLRSAGVDFLVSSANKCLQGVPGFAFVIARTKKLLLCQGNARCLSLDLLAQHKGLEGDGQFRFTPPTHALLAFRQALKEFWDEGGPAARAHRYKKNCQIIQDGMRELGFRTLLDKNKKGADGYIISSFRFPDHPNFNFEEFYKNLSALGLVIYPGKVTRAPCFRIGHIGDLNAADMERLIASIKIVLKEMKVENLDAKEE
ncbi:2-aminoethylphosphonate--pyruvate transaminase-like [Neocloeon triangulifer]|uniref:2-aminoethylphosphonate--pyruvate transaminase-like n=1 Tax=Neocloeon triangulifer TaxID=2078957 RepID=UPI00286F1536|nr:2-aminoethylphosphonate--pyruvate transaminase-like [Neocloeon triangulifer]